MNQQLQEMSSSRFGTAAGALMRDSNDPNRIESQEDQQPDFDQALNEIVDTLEPILVSSAFQIEQPQQSTETETAELGRSSTGADFFASVVARAGFAEDIRQIEEPTEDVEPALEVDRLSPEEEVEEITASRLTVEPFSIEDDQSPVPIPDPASSIPFVGDDGNILPLEGISPLAAMGEPVQFSSNDSLGVRPPAPTPQSRASGSFVVDRNAFPQEQIQDSGAPPIERQFTGGERMQLASLREASDAVDDFAGSVLGVLQAVASTLRKHSSQLDYIRDALFAEGSDDQV